MKTFARSFREPLKFFFFTKKKKKKEKKSFQDKQVPTLIYFHENTLWKYATPTPNPYSNGRMAFAAASGGGWTGRWYIL